jgi:recombination protein RecA
MTNTKNTTQDIINSISDKFEGSIIRMGDSVQQDVEVISSGSFTLNEALGCGGYPKGRIIEIYGNESSGKTTIALQAVAQAQKENLNVAYIDLEHALDPKYCELNSVDIKRLILAQPDSAEQTFNLIEALAKTEMVNLIVVDSVAAMVPQVELDGDMNDQTIGVHARIMSKGLRNIQPIVSKNNVTVIFINQIREKVGIMFGNPETTTGGRALRFYASIRMEVRRNDLIKQGDTCVGIKSMVKIVKNKLAPPLTKALVDIYFNKGFDPTCEIISCAIDKGIIEKRGA